MAFTPFSTFRATSAPTRPQPGVPSVVGNINNPGSLHLGQVPPPVSLPPIVNSVGGYQTGGPDPYTPQTGGLDPYTPAPQPVAPPVGWATPSPSGQSMLAKFASRQAPQVNGTMTPMQSILNRQRGKMQMPLTPQRPPTSY